MASADKHKKLLESLHRLYLRFLGTAKDGDSSVYARFLGGVVLGGFLVVLPLLYADIESWAQLTNWQLGIGVVVMATCGVLTVKLGEQFLDAVMKAFDNSGF